MGSRSSKHSPKSYDIAPVVANKDFSYTRSPRPLPEVILPPVEKANEEGDDSKLATMKVNNTTPTTNGDTIKANGQAVAENVEVPNKEIIPVNLETTTKTSEVAAKDEPIDARVPSWVSEENFKPLLVESYPTFKEIVKFKPYPALAAGENYATLMLRVKITIKLQDDSTKDISYMLKVAHNNKEMLEMLQHLNFFNIENCVYSEIITEIEEMYRQAGSIVEIAPKSHRLAAETPSPHYVLLDDLSLRGFKNANRLECLDMEHTLAVLGKLAQFHAATAHRVASKGQYGDMFTRDMDNEVARAIVTQMFSSFKKPFMDNLPTYENGEKYVEKMDKFFDHIVDQFISTRKPHPEFFNALNHADAWCNNMLFNYTPDGKLNELLFVDFQNSNYGPVAQDLLYFIISSVRVDIKVTKFEYFIRYYHQHLVENLQLLKYPGKMPNLRDLHIQIIEFGAWATFTSFLTMGVVLLDPTDNAKFENFLSENEEGKDFKHKIFSNPRYRKYINEMLPWLYNRGFMDTNDLDSNIAPTDKSIDTATTTSAVEHVPSDFTYPEWVNESYFNDIIRSDFESYQKILKFVVCRATSAGDNYSSIMLKVNIDIEVTDKTCHSISYMLKIPPAGAEAQAIINFMGSFEKEITAYNEILPQFEKVYKDQAGIDIVFGPKSYKPLNAADGDTLILENLKNKGFKNCDRLEGLDMTHTKAVLKKLAEFHAASAYVCETNGKFPVIFENSIYTEEFRKKREASIIEFNNIFYNCIKEFSGTKEYIDSVKHYLDNSFACMAKAHKVDEAKFNVLNHGDCWTNNIMFQHDDEGNVANTYFVDFQLLKYGSPAYDLYYFLLTSTKFELKLEYFDYFIRYYHENLKTCLELLKYPKHIPTLRELHVELLDQGTWAMYATMTPMSVILLDPTDNAGLELMTQTDESGVAFKTKMFSHQRYRSHAEALFPWMSRRGLLEVNLALSNSHSLTNDATPQFNVPSWVDAEHFKDILKQDLDNFDKIIGITTCSATKPGDNYASSMLRVKVDVALKDATTQTKSYILKLPLESEQEQSLTSIWNFFEKEIEMYSNYLKEFENLYAQHGANYVFGPKFYKFSKDVPQDILLMEDLGQRGFKCGDRRQGLDISHTKCVLRKLAQFHAASARYVELNGPFPEVFHKGIHTEESRHFFENVNLDFFYDYIQQFEHHEVYIDKMPNLLNNFVDHGIRVGKVDPTELNVLNHGDSWLNNIMFQHDEAGNIVETYYVDYQVCKYGSPAQDLWYFLISSTELDIKVDSFDSLINYYHEQLIENLHMLKYTGKIPTLFEFHQIMLKYGYIGFNTFFGVGAVCLLESNENANMTNFTADTPEGRRFRDALFLNDKYKANAAVVLPWLSQRGCLD